MLTVKDLRKPKDWTIWAGADTGTYMGGAICAINPVYELFVLEEFPNYRYVGDGTIELTSLTVSEWIQAFAERLKYWTGKRKVHAWVDANTTFKTEVGHGLTFRMNHKHLELRTSITQEYFRNNRIHFMPWLKCIPYEAQECKFPEAESIGTGRMVRIKYKDHCWDGVEHVCSRRPHPDFGKEEERRKSAIQQLVEKQMVDMMRHGQHIDTHMGIN